MGTAPLRFRALRCAQVAVRRRRSFLACPCSHDDASRRAQLCNAACHAVACRWRAPHDGEGWSAAPRRDGGPRDEQSRRHTDAANRLEEARRAHNSRARRNAAPPPPPPACDLPRSPRAAPRRLVRRDRSTLRSGSCAIQRAPSLASCLRKPSALKSSVQP